MNVKRLMKQVIIKNGITLQTVVAMEEMAELTKELSKNLRGDENHDAILEELADVYIVLEQIKYMHIIGNSELHGMINKKLLRLEAKMKGVESDDAV